jgi:hypothetical protein
MADYPFYEVAKTAWEHVAKGRQVHQKFTCAKCQMRLTMATANQFFETGTCDHCGHVTNIKFQGCNYLVIGKHDLLDEMTRDGH